MIRISLAAVLLLLVFAACAPARQSAGSNAQAINWKKVHVLVYSKNGKGYVHQNIGAANTAIQQLAAQYGFTATLSDNPQDFTEKNLQQYDALIFNNTNNDVFDTENQKLALMRYVQAGGGFVGLHSATGTERNWPWFKRLIGASFQRHARHQPFTEIVIDNSHPSTSALPKQWPQDDECYFFKEVNPDLHVLLAHDLSTLLDDKDKPDFYGASSPAAWCHQFDGGRQWYTSLGHDSATYFKPVFQQHILGGIQWVIGKQQGLDYTKAHAQSSADRLPY